MSCYEENHFSNYLYSLNALSRPCCRVYITEHGGSDAFELGISIFFFSIILSLGSVNMFILHNTSVGRLLQNDRPHLCRTHDPMVFLFSVESRRKHLGLVSRPNHSLTDVFGFIRYRVCRCWRTRAMGL